MVLEVNKVTEKGEWGHYVRVRVRIPLNRPFRRGGNIVLGEGLKCWVDYKYERLPILCHYCGMLDHEIRECPSKCKDVMEGCVKENSYGSWMAAASSFRRGYKWKERDQGFQRRWGGEVASSDSLDKATASGVFAGLEQRDGQLRNGHGKGVDEMESRDSRLIEVADNTVVAINGNQFRMGDLIPDFSRNLNITEAGGGLISGPSLEVGSGSTTWADGSLGLPLKEAQVHNNVLVNLGKGSAGLGGIDSAGSLFSSGSAQILGNKVDVGVNDQNSLLEVQVSNVHELSRIEKAMRVLPSSFRGTARGRKQTSISKRKISVSGESKEDGGGVSLSQNAGKRRLDVLESDGLAKQAGKRTFLGDITNSSRVEVAVPNRPPMAQ